MKNTYKIDASHSGIHFAVRHLMISTVRGSFSGVTGTVVHDTENPAATTIEAEVDVNSVNTNDDKRDGHLKSPDFFDIANYPVMKFVSTGAAKGTDVEYTVDGNLTLHGVTKPVTLHVHEVSEETKDPWGNIRVGATATGKLKRSDFGLVWNAPLETGGVMLGDEIKIEFNIEMVKA